MAVVNTPEAHTGYMRLGELAKTLGMPISTLSRLIMRGELRGAFHGVIRTPGVVLIPKEVADRIAAYYDAKRGVNV